MFRDLREEETARTFFDILLQFVSSFSTFKTSHAKYQTHVHIKQALKVQRITPWRQNPKTPVCGGTDGGVILQTNTKHYNIRYTVNKSKDYMYKVLTIVASYFTSLRCTHILHKQCTIRS